MKPQIAAIHGTGDTYLLDEPGQVQCLDVGIPGEGFCTEDHAKGKAMCP